MKRIFVVAAIIFSSRLSAQSGKTLPEETDTSASTLDEIVFTANKFPNKTSLTGKVLTVITREQLERSGGKDLSQLLNEQPGVYIGGANSNAGKDKSLYLRGAAIQHTLITIDGVPVYDASGIGSNFDIRNISIDNIERIEILKGSQSTLYGSDAIAGVINIITRKSNLKPLSGYGLISYGSYETLRFNAGINGKKDLFDYNLNYSFFNTRGINETADPDPNADKDGFQQNNLSFSFGLTPNKKIRIQPFFRYNNIQGDLDQGAFTDELDFTFKEKNYQAGIRNEFLLGKARLNLIYNYNNLSRIYTDDSTKSRNGFDIYSQGNYKGAEHFIDAYLHIALSEKIKLVGGADFRHSLSDQEYKSVSLLGPYIPSPNSRDSLNHTQTAVYGAVTFNTSKGFNLEAGNRLNLHSEYGTVDVFNLNPSFLFRKRVKLFSNFSTGFRTPSLYQLFSEYGNRDLKPETAKTWEAGIQYFSKEKKFMSRAVYFHQYIKDLIFFYTDFATFKSWYINQDNQKDHGIELEASYNFRKGTIKAFYSFVDGEITTRLNNKDTSFFNLLRRPKHSFGFNFGVSIGKYFYISSNLGIFGERKDAWFDSQTFQNVNVTLKSYALWDLYIEYGFWNKRLKAFTDLRNITNSKYSEVAGFNTAGFTVFGGIRCNL
jgi:vitamin B12 transporter